MTEQPNTLAKVVDDFFERVESIAGRMERQEPGWGYLECAHQLLCAVDAYKRARVTAQPLRDELRKRVEELDRHHFVPLCDPETNGCTARAYVVKRGAWLKRADVLDALAAIEPTDSA